MPYWGQKTGKNKQLFGDDQYFSSTKFNPNQYFSPHCLPQVNLFLANVPILYLLKIPENLPWKHQKSQRFSAICRGYKMGTLARNRLILEPLNKAVKI